MKIFVDIFLLGGHHLIGIFWGSFFKVNVLNGNIFLGKLKFQEVLCIYA